jgi:anthranilate synthase component I
MIPNSRHLRALGEQGFNLVPVWTERLADTETPVSAHLKLSVGEVADHSFLLESVEGGETVARYSFLGRDPRLVFRSRGGKWTVSGQRQEEGQSAPFGKLRSLVAECRVHQPEGLPPLAAVVGFAAYDSIRLVEKLPDTC